MSLFGLCNLYILSNKKSQQSAYEDDDLEMFFFCVKYLLFLFIFISYKHLSYKSHITTLYCLYLYIVFYLF